MFHVEYIGNIPVEKRDEVIKQLNQESTRLIQVLFYKEFVILYGVCESMNAFQWYGTTSILAFLNPQLCCLYVIGLGRSFECFVGLKVK